MESIEEKWKKLSLSDAEEIGVSCPKEDLPKKFILAAKFLTKRVINVESVARTFRPLWRSEKDVQLKDMGDHKIFFIFDDECDLNRVIEHEPWTYDKYLVIFERVVENIPISALSFRFSSFWVQIHDLPIQCLNSSTRDAIGKSLGELLLMTDTEEEGGKGNYLRAHVRIDISQPLSRVRKVWSDGSVISWAALKYERLPNFCYWCDMLTHDDRNCERWLRSKGSLKKEDQSYGAWLRAEADLSTRKTTITVPGVRQNHPKPAKQKVRSHDHQAELSPAKNLAASTGQQTVDPRGSESSIPRKVRPINDQTITDLTKTVGINDISNGAITSHYDESVQNAFMSSGNPQNGPNLRRDEFIQEEKRFEAESATKPDTISDGPVNKNKPIDQKDDKPNPKPLKTTWVRLA